MGSSFSQTAILKEYKKGNGYKLDFTQSFILFLVKETLSKKAEKNHLNKSLMVWVPVR